jgi:PAS domain S-box-containing protein
VPFLAFYLAVYVASLLGGLKPGLTATVLSALGGVFFIVEPRFTLRINTVGDALQLLLFVAVGLGISIANDRVRTANARLETAVADLENRNRIMNMALTTSMSGAWELNLETGQLSWNVASNQLHGLGRDLVPTLETFYSSIHPEDVDRIRADIDDCRTGRISSIQNDFRAILPEGIRHMECRGQVTRNKVGRPIRVVGITSDITERKLAEQERAMLEAKLVNLRNLESLGRLAGGVAHDFNNLLAVINGYAEVLSERLGLLDDPLRGFAMEISKAGGRAADMISQLLDFSQKQMIRPRLLDLNELIRESETSLVQLLGPKSQLVLTLEPDLGEVMADPDQMRQVLIDIIVNARDAMPDGGTVSIETALCEFAHAASGLTDMKPGPYVRITVTDTRIGVTEEYLSHIFEPFFTVKELRGVGVGLGLASVHGVVRQNKGWIEVQRHAGEGACFQICLPQAAVVTM